MTDDTDSDDSIDTVADAVDALDAQTGDSYVTAEWAHHVVDALSEPLSDALPSNHDAMSDAGDGQASLWTARYVANVAQMAKDAHGIPRVPQWRSIVLVADLSEQIAEDLDVPVGEGRSVGHARSHRQAHADTVQHLREHFDLVDEQPADA